MNEHFTIHITGTVLDHLTDLAEPGESANQVLERVLGLLETGPDGQPPLREPRPFRPGYGRRFSSIGVLLKSGELTEGDRLRFTRRRRGAPAYSYTVTIQSDGMLLGEDGRLHTSTTAAARDYTGIPGNTSTAFWVHLPTGRSLKAILGDRAARRPR
ncbi:hypothetical protein AB0A73_22085 [Glycomyces sp. NPDC047369]